MAYTVTEHKSWFSRLKDSVMGVIVGIIFFMAGTYFLWWNEGNTFKTAGAIGEAELATQDVPDISLIDPALEGKVIHAIGLADTRDVIRDSLFGLEANAINIERNAEFYQWQEEEQTETRKTVGGGEDTVTTYTYHQQWTSEPIDSSTFADPSYRNSNMTLADIESETFWAPHVTFGAYTLPDFLTHKIAGDIPVALEGVNMDSLSSVIKSPDTNKIVLIHIQDNTVYIGKDARNPEIGDVRVTFTKTPSADVSIIAQVIRDTFEPFTASNGYTFSRLEMGKAGSAKMFGDARTENNFMAWVIRAVCAVVVIIGLSLVMNLLSVVLDVIPFVGTIVDAGTGIAAFVIGLAWSLAVIGVAWVRFRPIVAGGLIAVALVLVVLSYVRGKRTQG